jgi:hypothetical protein
MPQMGEGEWRLGTNPQNVLSIVTLFSEYTRALTLENFCKASTVPRPCSLSPLSTRYCPNFSTTNFTLLLYYYYSTTVRSLSEPRELNTN